MGHLASTKVISGQFQSFASLPFHQGPNPRQHNSLLPCFAVGVYSVRSCPILLEPGAAGT